MAPISMILSHL